MNTPQARRIIDDVLETFGRRVMIHGGDVDEALECLTRELTATDLTRDDALVLVAYATRRLWYRYAASSRVGQLN